MKTPVKSIIIGALGISRPGWSSNTGNLKLKIGLRRETSIPRRCASGMLERMREQFDVKDDAEWKAISERIEKVMQARRSVGGAVGPEDSAFPGGRGGPGDRAGRVAPGRPRKAVREDRAALVRRAAGLKASPDAARPGGNGREPGGPGGFGRESNPELDALRKALDSKASAAEIKAKLAELRAARKRKEAELEKAQDELAKFSPPARKRWPLHSGC